MAGFFLLAFITMMFPFQRAHHAYKLDAWNFETRFICMKIIVVALCLECENYMRLPKCCNYTENKPSLMKSTNGVGWLRGGSRMPPPQWWFVSWVNATFMSSHITSMHINLDSQLYASNLHAYWAFQSCEVCDVLWSAAVWCALGCCDVHLAAVMRTWLLWYALGRRLQKLR